MAYNLQPLITILEQILDPQQTCLIHDDSKPQLRSLLEKAISLQQILEKSPPSLPNIEILESQIRDAAHKAEDIIESRMVDRMLSNARIESVHPMLRPRSSKGRISKRREYVTFPSPDLQQVMQELDSAMEQVVKLVEVETAKKMISLSGTTSSTGGASLNPKGASASASASDSASIHVVGFEKDLKQLTDQLDGTKSKLEIIPIVGMGGCGKTTLARKLYEDPHILSRFRQARAWTTVSQDYDMQTVLMSLISCITGKEVVREREVSELKDILYQSLFGRKYIIVIDDIWSTEVWDEMRICFPDNNNGSRIVITTRESDVARHANPKSRQHEVHLLSESTSWNLLRQVVFGEDDCPLVLEPIGRKMASDCGGLPLAITVIGGLLSKVERSKDVWENIGENVKAAIAESDKEQYSNLMSLSYNHLPNYLKPCFLYMGAFPEDFEIKGSRLICLWIAEGFVKSNRDKSLEEEAEGYLKGLVDRNLLMVRRNKLNGNAKSYIIHDLLRDLCIRKADEERFLHVMTNDPFRGMISKLRRLSSEQNILDGMEVMYAFSENLMCRSFLRTNKRSHLIVRCIYSVSKLLRVLDIRQIGLIEFPEEILQLVNLRYLGIYCKSLPVGIPRLVNLQTFVACVLIHEVIPEIWKMSRLRHLKFAGNMWSKDEDEIKELVQMDKLLTISSYVELNPALLERGFLEVIPNIKNLGVVWRFDSEIDLSHLHKLEILRYKSLFSSNSCRFPPSLKKLTLSLCKISWRTTSTLCGLLNLEVLKIDECKFEVDGTYEEWEASEGEEFRSLQFLELRKLKLVRWRADETNFPKLRHLLLRWCEELEEIPSGIGEIPTLELIEMKACSSSSVESAKQILEVQHYEYDNYALQLRINE